MKADLLVAEIGSTTTMVNAFGRIGTADPCFLGQGFAPTTVRQGDVRIGLNRAIEQLRNSLGAESLEWQHFLASSSAAGGLRMTVHGLVYDMTVQAAREAALGAGANIHQVTAGRMRRSDLKQLMAIQPNIIMIAGGVDYGERDTALYNAEEIARLDLGIPVIYAGNIQNHQDIKDLFKGSPTPLYIVENVYPSIDRLAVLPARNVIQKVFEEHIVHAPGMESIRQLVDGRVMPTPGAVMEASLLLKEQIGDLVTFDVGGATTDVHSVTLGSDDDEERMSPEPEAKRTVEGDLGVYISRMPVFNLADTKRMSRHCGIPEADLEQAVKNLGFLPKGETETSLIRELAYTALKTALNRHVGKQRDSFTSKGKKKRAEGRDLTAVTHMIGTGGALTRLHAGEDLLREVFAQGSKDALLPRKIPPILIDRSYIMASLGVLSKEYPQDAAKLLLSSLEPEKRGDPRHALP